MWAGEHGVLYGGLAVCQPIPLRIHVGVKVHSDRHDQPSIVLLGDRSSHYAYAAPEQKFEPHDFWNPGEAREIMLRADDLSFMATELLADTKFRTGHTFEIRSISEQPPGSGGNWSGAFASAMAAAVLAVTGQLDKNDLDVWQAADSPTLLRGSNPSFVRFQRCFYGAWALESVFREGEASGYGPLCALLGGHSPIAYRTSPRGSKEHPVDVGRDFDELKKIEVRFARLRDLTASERARAAHPSFYLGVVHTGVPKRPGRAMRGTRDEGAQCETLESRLDDRRLFSAGGCLSLNTEGGTEDLTALLGRTESHHLMCAQGLRDQMALVAKCSAHLFEALLEALEDVDEREVGRVSTLAARMRILQSALETLGLDWWQGRTVAARIYRTAAEHGRQNEVGVKLTGGGGGGSLVFILPSDPDVLMERVISGVSDLAKDAVPGAAVLWDSKSDGFEEGGVALVRGRG